MGSADIIQRESRTIAGLLYEKSIAYGLDANGVPIPLLVAPDGQLILDQTSGVITDANPQTFEDTSFEAGDSPATLDANTALGRNATEVTVFNDGAGNFTVAMSNDGATFGDAHTMKNGETYSFEKLSVDSIKITHVADSAYRVVVI